MSRSGKATGKYQSYLNTRNLKNGSGKATGKYQSYLNTRNLKNGTTQCID